MQSLSHSKAKGGGKLSPPPVNVLAAVCPVVCPEYIRTELLPYLALGFAPVFTSSIGKLCAIHALANGLRATKEALGIPANPRGHVSVNGLQRQLASRKWKGIVTEHIDKTMPELRELGSALRVQYIRDWSAQDYLDVTQIYLLLQLVNEEEKTNFCLGVVTRGFVTKKATVPTQVSIFNDGTGTQPVIWLYNNNENAAFAARALEDVEDAKARGGSGKAVAQAYEDVNIANHWEALAMPPEDRQETTRRALVRDWNFGPEIVEDVGKGVWRTTAGNLEGPVPVNGLAYDRGQFLRESPAPSGIVVPEGFRYMIGPATQADRYREGLVPESEIVRIELHPKAPTEAADLTPSTPVVDGKFRIYRGVTPAHKVGSTSPKAETLVRNGFNVRAGEFLYDLQQRKGVWIKVRRIDGSEGWAHPRTLEEIKYPWDLPNQIACLPDGEPVQHSENSQQSLDEANRWGFANNIDQELPVEFLKRFNRAEHALPFGLMKKAHETDQAKFSAGEMVLKASENTTNKKIEIVNSRGERAMVASNTIASISPAWGLAVSTETLHSLLTHVSARKLIKRMETDFGKHVADLELKSTPAIDTGERRPSEDDDNIGSIGKKRKRDEEQRGDASQMSEQDVAALRRRERLEAAERRRREAQSKKNEKT